MMGFYDPLSFLMDHLIHCTSFERRFPKTLLLQKKNALRRAIFRITKKCCVIHKY